jgi:membrane associated rhomboid family serine protease
MQRAYSLPPTPSVVKKLIYLNIFLYIITIVFNLLGLNLAYYMGLVPYLFINKLYIWQAISYLFLHGSFFHLLLNMLMLWMFGGELCRLWGSKFFLKYYMITGVGAGLCVVFMSYIFPSNFFIPTVGASGAIFGLFLAYGIIFKERYLYVFGLFPVKAKKLVIIMGLIELVSLLSDRNSSISHLAHLGGLIIGWLYLKFKDHTRQQLLNKHKKWKQKEHKDTIINVNFREPSSPNNWN